MVGVDGGVVVRTARSPNQEQQKRDYGMSVLAWEAVIEWVGVQEFNTVSKYKANHRMTFHANIMMCTVHRNTAHTHTRMYTYYIYIVTYYINVQ